VDLTSADPQGWLLLGLSEMGVKDFAAAAEDLAHYTSLSPRGGPEEALGWQKLGGCYWQLHRFHDAALAVRHAISINPSDPDLWLILWGVYQDSGQTQNALAAYEKYQALSPR
jgi:cytochrome c-type biogenesis protein CcmH/NrfG